MKYRIIDFHEKDGFKLYINFSDPNTEIIVEKTEITHQSKIGEPWVAGRLRIIKISDNLKYFFEDAETMYGYAVLLEEIKETYDSYDGFNTNPKNWDKGLNLL